MNEKRWWICTVCRYVLHELEAPETCPICQEKCTFIDATCYTPECGGPVNPDPRIVSRLPQSHPRARGFSASGSPGNLP